MECKVTQLVKLIKDNKPFKMSKRKGDYITLEDLINEVGKDAARFIMLSRVSDVELEFDFEKVKLKSKDNPLYYVQYSYARICSIFSNSKTPINNDYKNLDKNFEFNDEEIKIIRKLSEWPKCIETSINKLEPHRLTTYLYQLASIFHSYWNMGRDSEDFRYVLIIFFILIFFFLTIKYYLSDEHKKKYYRTVNEINNNLSIDDQNIPILKNDTQDIITYVDDKNEKTKPFSFWKLLNE